MPGVICISHNIHIYTYYYLYNTYMYIHKFKFIHREKGSGLVILCVSTPP